ncbi:MAG: VOC family protein [Candidatus Zixiibacteriota bacterium]|nr:MAG: VOC family protein [candidate division Zixibacteria bacterium]
MVENSGKKTGRFHHIEIYVGNLERSREFWGWILERLGYEKFQDWRQGFSYIQGDSYIVFVQAQKKYLEPPYHRCRVGLNHLAFHAGSKQNVDYVTDELRKRNVTILYEDCHPYAGGVDHYAVYFEDPDRIKVELVADD